MWVLLTGLDNNQARVEQLSNGISPLLDIGDDEIRSAIDNEAFTRTVASDSLSDSDIVLICVPTILEHGSPNVTEIEHAARAIAQHLHPGQLVVLESTTYPGTTEDLCEDCWRRAD